MGDFRDEDYYKEEIVKMVREITNVADLEIIYGMAKSAYKDTKKAEGN